MPFLGKSPADGNHNVMLDAITTSARADFALTKDSIAYTPVSAQSLMVSLNGVTQAPISAYTVSSNTITFASDLTTDDVIDYIIAFEGPKVTATLDAGTVGTSVIADDAVTSAKLADDAVVQAAIADEAVDEARIQISNAGSNGQVLTKQSGNTGGLTWATVGGAYSDWTILTTTPTTLVAKGQYLCNDTTARTHTLPSGSAGDSITICNAGSATVTLARTSSQKINSAAEDATLPQGNSAQLVYVDGTIGWFEI